MGLLEDARNIQRKDPAARSVLEAVSYTHLDVYKRQMAKLFRHITLSTRSVKIARLPVWRASS